VNINFLICLIIRGRVGWEMKNIKLNFGYHYSRGERIKPRMLVVDQKITKNEDGSIVFECTVNSLGEISVWIVCRDEGVNY